MNNWAQSDSLELLANQSKAEITEVIENLFTGMKNGDSSLVASTFHQEVRMMSSFTNKKNEAKIHEGTLNEFLTAVGTPHEEIWNERYSNVEILVDDNLAQVWMDYSFYVNENFSHCGVNALQMIKTDTGWKIIHLMDTRRKSECN
jgi:hypothetical protein